ncbi:efflux RND transporter periplasmic adaptor subunit [Alteromonas sp. a30]|uniref:efflux RND transporter periplasmic adaptor subunit n=1 Tax=Alteromonas sp. a30 TaxID=2730917 RepID=UPI002282E933|nr:efflux RND transporter periplasmic adaptor subunit [Alteromonas sp. a30]MCY7294962.1 efflux RND transporter periplasmic adaptor subunit [Alteromonas sp. a30]
MKKWLLLAVAVLLIGTILWSKREKPVSVSVAKVMLGDVAETVSNTRSGSVKACRRSNLSLSLGGQITQINVKEGDIVEVGELLLELANNDIQANIEQGQALINAAKLEQQRACIVADADHREHARLKKLQPKGLATEEQVDLALSKAQASTASCKRSEAQVAQQTASLKAIKANFDKTRLFAPFDGIVAEVNGEVGEYATPSPPGIATLPLIDLINAHCFFISAPLDEVDAGRLVIGQTVKINIDAYRDQSFRGKLKRIAPYVYALEKQARTVEVEVDIDNVNALSLLVGYSADVEVIIQERKQVKRIPTEALFNNNQVFVLAQNVLQKKQIETGLSNWRFTEVVSGLNEGDVVVTSTTLTGLADGVKAVAQ